MGLLDIASTVITKYKVDTNDAKAELKSLSAAQKQAAKEQIEAVEAQNKKLDGYVGALGKAAIALGAVTAAVLVGKAGFEAYTKHQQLAANTAGTNLDRLAKAADGLKTKNELLTFANNSLRGTWKLNQAQMETVLKGMRALELQGFDSAQVMQKFSMAFSKGNAEELKEYGINVKSMSGLLYELDERSRKATGSANAQGDEIRRAGVEFANAKDTIVQSIGSIVVSMAPLIVEVAKLGAAVAKTIAPIIKFAGGVAADLSPGGAADKAEADYYGMFEGRPTWGAVIGGLVEDTRVMTEVAAQMAAFNRVRGSIGTDVLNAGTFAMNQATRRLPTKRPGPGSGARIEMDNQFGSNVYDDRLLFGTPQSVGADFSTAAGLVGKVDIERLLGNPASGADRYAAFSAGRSKSRLEEMFGSIEDLKAYAVGFDLLNNAVTSAFSAWVDGSASLGDAIKKGIADGLVGVAGEMLSRSLLHAAHAVGSLAFYNYPQAALHAKSAAMFGAGAIAVGAIAKSLGGGGGIPGAGAGAGGAAPNVTGANANAGQSSKSNIIVLGDSYDDMTPRQRLNRSTKAINAAMREAGGTNSVRFE